MCIFSEGYLASYPVSTTVGRRGRFFHSFRRKLFIVLAAHLKDKEMVFVKKVVFFFPTSLL